MNTTKKNFPRESGYLDESQVKTYLQAFYHWYEGAVSPAQQCSRSRVLFVCLLVRFAALRLGEALALDDISDFDESNGLLHVRGKWARDLPLPSSSLKRLLELRDSLCNIRVRGRLCRLDPAYVRRVFARRAEEAGIPWINPTTLRNFREQELLHHGVPLSTVKFFLGRRREYPPESGEIENLQRLFRQWEYAGRIGRHNIVCGTPKILCQGEFSCFLELTTTTGLVFTVHCSTRTFARLGLADRHETKVFVRSLQVQVLPNAVQEKNCFPGTVVDLLTRENEARVMIRLSDDSQQFCSIMSLRRVRELSLKRGAHVWILIRSADFTFFEPERPDN